MYKKDIQDWDKFIEDAKNNLAEQLELYDQDIRDEDLYLMLISNRDLHGIALGVIQPPVMEDEMHSILFADDTDYISGAMATTTPIKFREEATYVDHFGARNTIHYITDLSDLNGFKKAIAKLRLLGKF